ncbi:MAG: glycerol-3-phosphate responsive antiterminator [Spirochaetaceae bacterium]|nr:glycerol-3-phosphate responsive antiterminator [Spirochaetaceae bacterium]
MLPDQDFRILFAKTNLLKHAKFQGTFSGTAFFVLDSISLLNIEKQFPLDHADAVEILPGVIPKIIRPDHQNNQ